MQEKKKKNDEFNMNWQYGINGVVNDVNDGQNDLLITIIIK